ncbi:hypothetical protein CR513_34490, partial [Mucuna pruriens]
MGQLQARSEEHSRLSAEAETRHRLVEERHAEAMKMAEQREEELRQQIASLKVRGEGLAQPVWRQPFCEEIDEARIPPNFREILVDPFYRTQDPHAHLQDFQTQMYISGGYDKLSCKLFPGTLRGVALQWMMNLPPRSIHVFSDLVSLFLSQFAANKPKHLEVADLFDIKQAGGESLKSYMARFNDATVKKGLRVGPFNDALALQKPMSMEEIRVRAEKHVKMEESRFEKREAEHLSKEGRPRPARERPLLIGGRELHRRQDLDRRHEIPPKFTPLKEKKARIMREIYHARQANGEEQERVVRFSQSHQSFDRGVLDFGSLARRPGPTRTYVARAGREKVRTRGETSGREERNREHNDRSKSPRPVMAGYRGTISTISRGEEPRVEQGDRRRQNAHESYQVQGVLTGANLTPLGERRKEHVITFQEKDRRWRAAGDEPMVISVVTEDFRVERVLIDQGSSANILYGSTYRRMGLSELKESPRCLYGFLGERVPIRGTMELGTIFGEGANAKMIPVLYTVIEAEASYNIIMGRPALNQLKAIVSTYHLCMKYPTSEGVGIVWADSNMAKRCYEDSLRVGQQRSVVNTLSLELDPRGHNERKRSHPVEKLKEI